MIEMMVVVAIMAILASIAAPSFQGTVERYRVNTAVDELVSAFTLTRAEAIKRGGNVRIERLSGGDCPALGSDQEWSCGWLVFVDANTNDTLDAGEVVVQRFRITNGVRVNNAANATGINANRWGQLGGLNAVGFNVVPPSGVSSKATTTMCLSSGGRIRKATGVVAC